MELQFFTLDVFTNTRLEGNPLAVVSVPSTLKEKLSQETKQKIAKEFNLSETVFLHEGSNADSTERHIDIFTIESELPFAGHPTIGTSVLVKYHLHPSVNTLVAKCGPIGLETGAGDYIRAKIPHNAHLHAKTLGDVVGPDHPGLSSHQAIREAELRAPVFSIVNGMTFLLVRLPSLEALGKVQTTQLNFEELKEPLLDEGWRDSFVARYYYVDIDVKGDERLLRTRMVAPGFEDPATGSAASALGAFLTLTEEKRSLKFEITQGVEMGRRSIIRIETIIKEDSEGAKGCTPIRAACLSRHAAIYANDYDFEEYIEPFVEKLENHTGIDWSQIPTLNFLRDWVAPITEAEQSFLTRFGKLEAAQLGVALSFRAIIERLNALAPEFNFTANGVYSMMELCGYETVIRGSSSFCDLDLFSSDDWLDWEYSADLHYHYNSGCGFDLSGPLGLPWLNATANFLSEDSDVEDLYMSFTHRELLPMVAVAMGLFNNSEFGGSEATVDDTMPLSKINHRRAWKSSNILPFLGNLAVERLNCTGSYGYDSGEYYRVLVNSAPQPLPGCADGPGTSCSKNGVESYVEYRLQMFPGFSEKCGVYIRIPQMN
ncbi:hypothetical protein DL764_010860 [Monosporascus ibericus]|uniref:Uncharacterized protein n=1 Tax=Monosporascus ibericus TaxID=155417 RepID=A0A4Q4SRW7_9PEZI|nr:hypothetical protein DL764_010860 [Monosporascus ibericus]